MASEEKLAAAVVIYYNTLMHELRILTGKKHSQIKLQRLQKVEI